MCLSCCLCNSGEAFFLPLTPGFYELIGEPILKPSLNAVVQPLGVWACGGDGRVMETWVKSTNRALHSLLCSLSLLSLVHSPLLSTRLLLSVCVLSGIPAGLAVSLHLCLDSGVRFASVRCLQSC